jgi:hypothetical protein
VIPAKLRSQVLRFRQVKPAKNLATAQVHRRTATLRRGAAGLSPRSIFGCIKGREEPSVITVYRLAWRCGAVRDSYHSIFPPPTPTASRSASNRT